MPTLFWKVLSNFRRNLTIRHLVKCFNTYDSSTKVVSFKTFFQFALCVTRTKYQNRFCITNRRNYCIVVNVEMSRERSLTAVICMYLLWFVATPKRGITGTAELFFNLRYYQPCLFPFVCNSNDNSLPNADPMAIRCMIRRSYFPSTFLTWPIFS